VSTSLIAVAVDLWGFCSSFSEAVAEVGLVARYTRNDARTPVLDHAWEANCSSRMRRGEGGKLTVGMDGEDEWMARERIWEKTV
jgi:hypothetical protein